MKLKFEFIGYTPAHGKIYSKGAAQLVIYNSGEKKYWSNFKKHYVEVGHIYIRRNKSGMIK